MTQLHFICICSVDLICAHKSNVNSPSFFKIFGYTPLSSDCTHFLSDIWCYHVICVDDGVIIFASFLSLLSVFFCNFSHVFFFILTPQLFFFLHFSLQNFFSFWMTSTVTTLTMIRVIRCGHIPPIDLEFPNLHRFLVTAHSQTCSWLRGSSCSSEVIQDVVSDHFIILVISLLFSFQ